VSFYTVIVHRDRDRENAVKRASWAGHASHEGVVFAGVVEEPTALQALIASSVALERMSAEVVIAVEDQEPA